MRKINIGIFAFLSTVAILSIGANNKAEESNTFAVYQYIIEVLGEHFVDEIDTEELQYNALHAALKSLDPHSHFYDQAETKERTKTWDGILRSGIGINILYRGGYSVITSINDGSPAMEAGLRAGDVILEVNGEKIYEAYTSDVAEKIIGEPDTEVELFLERPAIGKFKKTIVRGNIPNVAVPFVGMATKTIGYLKLNHFYGNAGDTMRSAITQLKAQQNLEGIILDFRNNAGGGVLQAIDIMSLFVPKGSIVYSLKKRGSDFEDYKTEKEPIAPNIPLVILVNGSTISAPELLAGAFQDYDRAVVIGQQTFGKGLVQTTWNTGDSTSMYFTTSRYYTPLRRCIQKMDFSDHYLGEKPQIYQPEKKAWFTTPNGRQLYDWSGIVPDIQTELAPKNTMLSKMAQSWLFFDFVNNLRNTHETIKPARGFKLDDVYFELFIAYLKEKNYDFELPGQKLFDNFQEALDPDGNNERIKRASKAYLQILNDEKLKTILDNKEEVKRLISEAILYRYYGYKSQYELAIDSDKDIEQSIKLLLDTPKYNELLSKK